jgi:hypothetical protein
MTEIASVDGPSVAKDAVTVSASALALHLDCSRMYISKLEAEGVIQRHGDGFPLEQSRVDYIRYLRRERRQSPRSEADADHVKVKTEMLQLRLMEKKRELVRRDDVNALLDEICGLTLTHLGSWPARIAGADLGLRRRAEAVLRELRVEISKAASKLADERGKAPFAQQG